jgi:hypothetical protein
LLDSTALLRVEQTDVRLDKGDKQSRRRQALESRSALAGSTNKLDFAPFSASSEEGGSGQSKSSGNGKSRCVFHGHMLTECSEHVRIVSFVNIDQVVGRARVGRAYVHLGGESEVTCVRVTTIRLGQVAATFELKYTSASRVRARPVTIESIDIIGFNLVCVSSWGSDCSCQICCHSSTSSFEFISGNPQACVST